MPLPRSAYAFALVAVALSAACRPAGTATPPVASVAVATVEQRDMPLVVRATGTVEPIRTVAVEPQVGGIITGVRFREGQDVRQGQTLFQLDPRPYRAARDQARAVLQGDLAQLERAEREQARVEELARSQFVSDQELDLARSTRNARAAAVAADSAALEQALLRLQYATIRAPISGRAGAILVREGNLARTGANQRLVTINQVSPIQVRFAVPAAYLGRLQGRGALAVKAMPVGDTLAETGALAFLDNAVDTLTGTVQLKATFRNPQQRLWPGALVRVALELEVDKDVLVVPVAAVIAGQQGSTVFVIDGDNRAVLRRVTVRRSDDSLAVLADGVKPGERVVTDGQLRLTDGAAVAIRAPLTDTQ